MGWAIHGVDAERLGKFLHHKDRSPPRIKLHRTLLDNAEFQRLPVASRALAPMLWLLAAEYGEGTITAKKEDITWRLRMSLDEFNEALTPLIDGGFFTTSGVLAECKRDAMPETETDSRSIDDRPSRALSCFEEFWKLILAEMVRIRASLPKPSSTRL
jgi:hypothetical protein